MGIFWFQSQMDFPDGRWVRSVKWDVWLHEPKSISSSCMENCTFSESGLGLFWKGLVNIMAAKMKARIWDSDCYQWSIFAETFYLLPSLFCGRVLHCRWVECQRWIFKASSACLPRSSWEASNNGIISDKVLRVAWPFLPLHKHRLKCVQLCMIPLQYLCLL